MSTGKFIYKGNHRQFNYVPQYFDPRKEALDQKESEIRQQLGLDDYESKVGVGMFNGVRGKQKKQLSSVVGTRFILILILLTLPVMWVIFGEQALWLGGGFFVLVVWLKYGLLRRFVKG